MITKIIYFIAAFYITSIIWIAPVLAAQVHLAWDPSDGKVLGYRLYYGTRKGNHPNKIEVGNKTDYIVSGLSTGTTYYFVVRAYNEYGESADSNEIMWSTTSDVTAPGDVSNVKFMIENDKIKLSWTNPIDDDFAGVKIVYTTDNTKPALNDDGSIKNGYEFCNIKGATTCSKNLTNLLEKTYNFAFFSYDINSNYSHTTHLLVPKITVSPAPSIMLDSSLTVNFKVEIEPASLGDVNYNWDFDDGEKSNLANPSHTFKANKKRFNVSLKISNQEGCEIVKYITVQNSPPSSPKKVEATFK